MASINERLSTVESKLEENNRTTWRVFEAIYGNGKPGLIAEFKLLRQSVEKHHKEADQRLREEEALRIERKTDWKWIATTIVAIAAVVAAIIK